MKTYKYQIHGQAAFSTMAENAEHLMEKISRCFTKFKIICIKKLCFT